MVNMAPTATSNMMQTEQQAPSMPNSQGAEGAPMLDEGVANQLDAHMGSLPDESKKFIVEHLTPEIATIFGMIFGQEVFDYFRPFADPSIVLVPVPRDEVMNMTQQNQQPPQGAPADSGVPQGSPEEGNMQLPPQ